MGKGTGGLKADGEKKLSVTVEVGPIDPEKREEFTRFLLSEQPWPAVIWEWFEMEDDRRGDDVAV